MHMNLIQSYMAILAGVYFVLPANPYLKNYRIFQIWIHKLKNNQLSSTLGQFIIILGSIVFFIYSPWYALNAALWYFGLSFIFRDYRRRKCDRELCIALNASTKQLCNILGSGQLLLPALSQVAELTQNSLVSTRLYQLINSLQHNLQTRPEEYLSVDSNSKLKFDELWGYFQRIIMHGLWHGMSMVPVCDSFSMCLDQIIMAEEKIAASNAGSVMSAIIMAILPVFGLGMGTLIGAKPWQILLNKNLGGVLILAGSLCTIIGLLWSRRIIIRAANGA